MANPRFWTDSKIISYVAEKIAGAAGVTWATITGKPSTFTPSTHTHVKSDLAADVQASLEKADTALQSHQSLADYAKTADVVAKVDGKGLSTNDYTTAEKQKLAGIADGATKVEVVSPDSGDGFSGKAADAKKTGEFLDKKVNAYYDPNSKTYYFLVNTPMGSFACVPTDTANLYKSGSPTDVGYFAIIQIADRDNVILYVCNRMDEEYDYYEENILDATLTRTGDDEVTYVGDENYEGFSAVKNILSEGYRTDTAPNAAKVFNKTEDQLKASLFADAALTRKITDVAEAAVDDKITTEDASLVALIKKYGGTQIKEDEKGFYYEVEEA